MMKELTLEQGFLRLLLHSSVYLIQPHVTDPQICDRRNQPECYKDFYPCLGITCKQRRKSAGRSRHDPLCSSMCLSTPLSGLSWVSCRRKLYIGLRRTRFIFHCLQRVVLCLKAKISTTHTKSYNGQTLPEFNQYLSNVSQARQTKFNSRQS
jgi:hypothetical protein